MEEYAHPVPFKELKFGPESETLVPNLVPEPENLVPKLRRPKPLNTTKHTLKEIEDANYNPFSQNYAIVSPSRYSCNYTKRENKNKLDDQSWAQFYRPIAMHTHFCDRIFRNSITHLTHLLLLKNWYSMSAAINSQYF